MNRPHLFPDLALLLLLSIWLAVLASVEDIPEDAAPSPRIAAVAESPSAPAAPDAPVEPAPAAGETVRKGVFSKGSTVGEVLAASIEEDVPVRHYVRAASEVFPLRSFRAGQPYTVVSDPDTGRLMRFEYEINDESRLVVEGDDKPRARLERIHYDVELALVQGRIEDSLFEAVADAGESPQLALRLAEIFGSEINFLRDLHAGDTFVVLQEKRYRDGESRGYGRTLGAALTCRGRTYEAFLYMDESGRPRHYNAQGENLTRALMQAPLSFTRISSTFSASRRHPVLGYSRPHPGVDYAAPTGTPVKSVGDGVVTWRAWRGGYGNHVVIDHGGGLETLYSHLSGYARGLARGQRVRQGEVIGFVGSTGLSTGPHLDFRVQQDGTFIDPAKAINPRGKAVARARMEVFAANRSFVRAYMEGARSLMDYSPDDYPVR